MGCLVRTTLGELRVIADYAAVCAELRNGDDGWLEVQEQNDVQTRHLIRRSAVIQVTELLEKPTVVGSARILGQ